MESGPRWSLRSALLCHTRSVKVDKSAAELGIFRSRKRWVPENTDSIPFSEQYLMDKKETTVTQCLSTPVRDEPGSLVTENGGHSLLPSPLAPIPHSKAQTRALAHPRRRTREICGDYDPKNFLDLGHVGTETQRRCRGRRDARKDSRLPAWRLPS